jgi:FkbM family methyltransferase
MEKVGQSKNRNQKYFEKFNREIVIKNLVNKEDPICFDIGAHHGESVNNPLIYSFEPSPKSFEILKNNNYKNNICFNYAISNITGNTVFYENEISHTNSLVKINSSSLDSIEKQKTINSQINIKAIRLDDFIIEQKINKIDLLKVDVQGAESLVFEGSQNTLKKTKVVIVEICFFDYYENKGGFFDIEKFLKPKGFNLFSISEISYNPMNGRTDWVEAIYKKDI